MSGWSTLPSVLSIVSSSSVWTAFYLYFSCEYWIRKFADSTLLLFFLSFSLILLYFHSPFKKVHDVVTAKRRKLLIQERGIKVPRPVNVRFVDKIKKFCWLKLGLVIQDELRAGYCYFLYLISVLLALFKDFSDLFFFLGVLSESACYGWSHVCRPLFNSY